MIYQLITQWAGKASVDQLCRLFQVSRSGYYAARERAMKSLPALPESARVAAIYASSDGSYGSRRISKALKEEGLAVGRHRAATLMKACGLRAKWRRKFIHTTDSRHGLPIAPNLLNRNFSPAAPNQAWVSDVTYIRTRSGWLYLAVVMDLYSRKIIGWAMAPEMPAQLVCAALYMAICSRKPAAGLIVHSDRGCQYASAEYASLLRSHGLLASMSRKANCWDNAVMERFFLSLKMERVWQRDYANHGEARRDVADYIVGFYNSTRLHSTLNYCSPAKYEARMLAAA